MKLSQVQLSLPSPGCHWPRVFACNLQDNAGENTGESFDVKCALFKTKGFTLIATGQPAGFTWDNLK